jgi:hypothetical protein
MKRGNLRRFGKQKHTGHIRITEKQRGWSCDARPQRTGPWPRHKSVVTEMTSWPFHRDEKGKATNQELVKQPKISAREKAKGVERGRREGA